MHIEHPARIGDAGARGQVEQLQAVAVQNVMIRHAAHDPFESLARPRKREPRTGRRRLLIGPSGRTEVAGHLGERPT